MDLGLRDRAALVCGSSAGLGRAVAQRLAAEGTRVAVNGRDAAKAEGAAAGIRADTGGEAVAFAADVSDPRAAETLVRAVAARFGRLDVLVCNAGGPPATTFAEAPPDAWQRALDLNLMSTVHLCRAAVPLMAQRHWGRIVCMTSFAARQPMPNLILSTTARAAVFGFAKSLADEVAGHGILVTTVLPGWFRTDRVTDLAADRARREGSTPEAILSRQVAAIPVGRMGDPDELASAVAFLASERASYITGAVLAVDGGYLRSIV
ncbi:MAG TPA: SDR family oxidoreductase [Gemmatimonadales bacterium]|nr:SDR family oxidoreductase [Gemmatimonadales bacterium]